jgi:digeranylgeranylglycerophospholipid reductase
MDSGCTILSETVFRGLSLNGHAEKGDGGKTTVSTSRGDFDAEYVVGADGFASNVGRAAGLSAKLKDEDTHIGLEYRVPNDNVQDPEVYRIYWGQRVAPRGYAWSFPDGPDRLRIGLGVPISVNLRPKDLLARFIQGHSEFSGGVLASEGGVIPTGPPLKSAVRGSVLLVGDAGRFCNALLGAGITTGMVSGQLAGLAIQKGSAPEYDAMWKARFEDSLWRHYRLKKVMFNMSDRDFDDMIKVLKMQMPHNRAGSAGFGDFEFLRALGASPRFVLSTAISWALNGLGSEVAGEGWALARRTAKKKTMRLLRRFAD